MKLTVLYEMDRRLRTLERLAAGGDEDAAEQLKTNKIRSVGGWRLKVYETLEMAKSDDITMSILPQLINRIIPLEDKVGLVEMMVRELLPNWVDKVGPRVQEVVNKDWDAANRSSNNARAGLAKTGDGWWPQWDDGSTHRGYLLDSWVRILAGMETHDKMVEGRVNEAIAKFYYGPDASRHSTRNVNLHRRLSTPTMSWEAPKESLRELLMSKINEMILGSSL
jgi:hypothetical protein